MSFIQGDNGSGKSSICDAIEFAVRAIVSRRMRDGEKQRREVQNLSSQNPPGVVVTLSNGSSFVRGFIDSKLAPGATRMGREPVTGFDRAPIVIRRDAVESFWRIPPESRLDYFWDFLKKPNILVRSSKDDELIARHAEARATVRKARQEIDRLLPRKFYPPGWALPTHSTNAYAAIAGRLQQVIDQYANNPGKINAHERGVITAYVNALAEEEALRGNALSAKAKKPRQTDLVRGLLSEIAPRITADFFGIFGQDWVTDITFSVDEEGVVRIALVTPSGTIAPEQVLSEAGLDILSLLVAVEAHIATVSQGQYPIVAFDDVFQSVDSPLRSRVLAHLASRLKGWQVVMTVHDRLWLEVADQRFKELNFKTRVLNLRGGGFGGTPTLLEESTGLLRDVESCLANGASPVLVAGAAGRALEALAEHLSSMLSAKVTRKERDRYEINDLWIPVKAEIDASRLVTAKALAGAMSNTQFLRNRVGAHANDWADGLSDAEAFEAADQVMRLTQEFRCRSCGSWGKRIKDGASWILSFRCCQAASAPV